MTPLYSDLVAPARFVDCPAQMEVELVGVYEMVRDADTKEFIVLEIKVLRTSAWNISLTRMHHHSSWPSLSYIMERSIIKIGLIECHMNLSHVEKRSNKLEIRCLAAVYVRALKHNLSNLFQ